MRTLDELGISPAPWKYKKADSLPFYWIDPVASSVCNDNMEADARLIAALPRMYKAAYDLLVKLGWLHVDCAESRELRAALEAASGESEEAK